MVRGIKREIWHIRCSVYFDPVEPAGELAHGMQSPPNPLDGVQVSMLERVLAGNGGIAGSFRIPWAKVADGVNLSFWHCVDKSSVVGRPRFQAHIVEHNMLTLENLRIFIWFICADHES